MTKTSNEIQLQYSGFLNTPLLWLENPIFGLHQFQIPNQYTIAFNDVVNPKLRLGKCVERFVSYQLNAVKSIDIVAENIQIQQGKLTLGELDCLLKFKGEPMHLEVVYKFYLYDDSVGVSELEHWIGPNRNDSLVKKVTKLRDQQLPILYAPEAKIILDRLNLKSNDIKQRVFFKAQLFVPLKLKSHSFEMINNECVNGIYMTSDELKQFSDCKFHLPTKINWLMDIQTQTTWLSFDQISPKLNEILVQKTSPLCWIKHPNGELIKCFIVWW